MSSPSGDKEIGPPNYDAFSSVNKLVREAYEILKSEVEHVRQEREAFESVAKKIEHVHFTKTIKLNVGGQHFTTSLETLTKDHGSMLHAMFSGRFDVKPAEDGAYFIDRDGAHFKYILNFLRTGRLIMPEDETTLNGVLVEAEFYQIQGMIERLSPLLFAESTILSAEQRRVVTAWIKEELERPATSTFVLLHRASRDGWRAADFHSRCDKKGPTITVVKSGNYIFGGYTDQSWDGSGDQKASEKSFLFSLVNPSCTAPTKMILKPDKTATAMYCNKNYGPSFGDQNADSDLRICSEANSKNESSTSLDNCYECPEGQPGTKFLVDDKSFTVNEYEVFGYQK